MRRVKVIWDKPIEYLIYGSIVQITERLLETGARAFTLAPEDKDEKRATSIIASIRYLMQAVYYRYKNYNTVRLTFFRTTRTLPLAWTH